MQIASSGCDLNYFSAYVPASNVDCPGRSSNAPVHLAAISRVVSGGLLNSGRDGQDGT